MKQISKSLVKISLVSLLISALSINAAEAHVLKAKPVSDREFVVAVGDGQPIGDAIVLLAYNRPEMSAQIENVLSSMPPKPGFDATGALSKVREQRNARRAVPSALSSPVYIDPQTGFASQEVPVSNQTSAAVAAAGGLTFSGNITITGFRCNSVNCVPESTLVGYTNLDLYYASHRWLSKVSVARTGWTNISLGTNCYKAPTDTAGCGGYLALAIATGYQERYYTTTGSLQSPAKASFLTSFSAAYLGSPASLSGRTGYFTCTLSDRQCRFL
jgi:hypothetical protein